MLELFVMMLDTSFCVNEVIMMIVVRVLFVFCPTFSRLVINYSLNGLLKYYTITKFDTSFLAVGPIFNDLSSSNYLTLHLIEFLTMGIF